MSLKVWLPLLGSLENKGTMMNIISSANTTVNTSGKIGSCYSFNGSSSYIKINNAPFNNTTTEFSYACWFKPANITSSMCLYSNRNGVNSTGITIFMFNSGKILFDTGGRAEISTPSGITANTWCHLVFTWKKNGIKAIYVNGVKALSVTQSDTISTANTTNAFIGASQDSATTVNANYLNGLLNDVRIYDHCLSPAEIKNLSQALVLHYKLDDVNLVSGSNIVHDSSGYGHNGIASVGLSSIESQSRHANNVKIDEQGCIESELLNIEHTSFTFNIWAYASSLPAVAKYCSVKVRNNAYFNFGCTSNGGVNGQFLIFSNGNKYTGPNGSVTLSTNQWNMWTCTFDGTTAKVYKNASLYVSSDVSKSYTYTLPDYSYFLGYNNASQLGYASDIRIYATVLSDNDIKELYNVNSSVIKPASIQAYDFVEDASISVNNDGTVTAGNISESSVMAYLKYDNNIYVEPDGSMWVRVYHHNNPGAGSFSSTNDFENSVYIDDNRWFNVEVANHMDKWEIMIKGKFTSTASEWKLRWIQQYNPMTATYANVAASQVTKISNGYSTSPSAWGGLYKKNGSAYLTANNGTESNWWGAVGSFSVYQSGIPGWGPSATVTTTGYNDMYLRIDNINQSSVENVSFKKNQIILSDQFIEI